MQRSAYVLGRRPVQERIERYGECLVSVVLCNKGTPEEWRSYIECPENHRSGRRNRSSVLYRIRVKMKSRA